MSSNCQIEFTTTDQQNDDNIIDRGCGNWDWIDQQHVILSHTSGMAVKTTAEVYSAKLLTLMKNTTLLNILISSFFLLHIELKYLNMTYKYASFWKRKSHSLQLDWKKGIFQFHSKSHTHIEYMFQWIWRAHGDFNTHIVITDACHHNTIFRYTLFVFALRIHSIFTWLCVYLALCIFFRHFDRCCFECYFLFLKFFLVLFSLVFFFRRRLLRMHVWGSLPSKPANWMILMSTSEMANQRQIERKRKK